MEKQFNLSRYKELFKLDESNKIPFSLEDEIFLELLSYKASVEKQFLYNRKKDYFSLISEYLNQVISSYDFRSKFLEMIKEDSKKAAVILNDFQKLKVFTLSEGIEKISDLLTQISILCFKYGEVWDGTMKPMSESEFYSLVNNLYLQLRF